MSGTIYGSPPDESSQYLKLLLGKPQRACPVCFAALNYEIDPLAERCPKRKGPHPYGQRSYLLIGNYCDFS
jgi:hypothetical protein